MKVRELIEALAALDPDADVFMAKDAEGNEYKPIEEACVMEDLRLEVNAEMPWVVDEYWQEGLINDDERAVVIWPVN